ncbi:hypothetical protein [Rhodococcoides fascians]|uniref:hypothetical protein n=1 Tax=Rhodococcoides fascians TaxID=1828 RepID=UPI0012D2D5A0|nr:hypothetical protein [Rhodococcus fascians]
MSGDPPTSPQSDPMLDDLAQLLLEKLDVLLDRLTDRALASPRAGSAAWRSDWLDRSTDDGRDLERRRVLTRIGLASRAGLTPGRDVAVARSLGVTDAELRAGGIDARPRAKHRPWHHRDQLAMFEM